VVDMVITDLAVFKFAEGKLTLVDLMPTVSLAEVKAKTAAKFVVAM
jgi:3-oxoacid CoA-transferase